jgi:hypothetical protein
MNKLQKLLEIEGYDAVEDLLEAVFSDSISPGICMNDGCDYTVEVEPDQTQGWCDECRTNSVKAAAGEREHVAPRCRNDTGENDHDRG